MFKLVFSSKRFTSGKSIDIDVRGLKAVALYKENDIAIEEEESTCFTFCENLEIKFSLEEVTSSKLLTILFNGDNYRTISIEEATFNEMVDIKKAYNKDENFLKDNYKEIFYKIMNDYLDSCEITFSNGYVDINNKNIFLNEVMWNGFSYKGISYKEALSTSSNLVKKFDLNSLEIDDFVVALKDYIQSLKFNVDEMIKIISNKKSIEFNCNKYFLDKFNESLIGIACISPKQERILISVLGNLGYKIYDDDGNLDIIKEKNAVYASTSKTYSILRDKILTVEESEFTDIAKISVDCFINSNKDYYYSELVDFNGHSFVKFYENEYFEYRIEFAEGCKYKFTKRDLKGLEEFEKSVEEKYGDDKNNIIYRTYMLEADKFRLHLGLKARENIKEVVEDKYIIIKSLTQLIEDKSGNIDEYISKVKQEGDKFANKNEMWFDIARYKIDEENLNDYDIFKYLEYEGEKDDNLYYYDLVTVNADICNDIYDFAIPVPILAEILGIPEEIIYKLIENKYDLDEIEYI